MHTLTKNENFLTGVVFAFSNFYVKNDIKDFIKPLVTSGQKHHFLLKTSISGKRLVLLLARSC